jgi:hypothetical protein
MKKPTTTTRSRKGVTVYSLADHAISGAIAELEAVQLMLRLAGAKAVQDKKGAGK